MRLFQFLRMPFPAFYASETPASPGSEVTHVIKSKIRLFMDDPSLCCFPLRAQTLLYLC